jgi:hypothetical protein
MATMPTSARVGMVLTDQRPVSIFNHNNEGFISVFTIRNQLKNPKFLPSFSPLLFSPFSPSLLSSPFFSFLIIAPVLWNNCHSTSQA